MPRTDVVGGRSEGRTRAALLAVQWRETLIFELGGRRFGLPASEVQELVRMVAITPAPPGSGPIEGFVDFRGAIVPVFDLRARLGLPPRAADPSESLAIVRRGPGLVAIRVDRPLELAAMPAGVAGEAGAGAGAGVEVGRGAEGLAILLDLGHLLEPAGGRS